MKGIYKKRFCTESIQIFAVYFFRVKRNSNQKRLSEEKKKKNKKKKKKTKKLKKMFTITKTNLFKYTENFYRQKKKNQIKNSDIFHFYSQSIDCGCETVLTSTPNLCCFFYQK